MSHVQKFASELFSKGMLEVHVPNSKPAHPYPETVGGAKLWTNTQGLRGNRSKLEIHKKELNMLLRDINALVITTSRITLDEEGNPQYVTSGNGGYMRGSQGLILYPVDGNPATARQYMARAIELMPELKKFGVIGIASDLAKQDKNIEALGEYTVRNFINEQEPINIDAAIILSLAPGPKGSAAYWGNSNQSVDSRSAMSEKQTFRESVDTNVDLSDLPF